VKRDFALRLPLLNAAGFLGFAPDARGPLDLENLGAFVTNPVSLAPRTPAHGPRCLVFPGGFLLHTGHPNPGLRAVLRRCAGRWARAPLPVVVHLLAQSPEEAGWMARRLEGLDGVLAVELGLPPDVDPAQARAILEAVIGELPVIARLPLDRAGELAGLAAVPGLAALSLGAPRGVLPDEPGHLVSGRLYGPALFPLALGAVRALSPGGIPVIGAGGVYSRSQAQAMLAAGAVGVQLDAVLWRGGWK
jgi:dihydroorotate dehydrogenase (NAD+) catalytic subunit